MAPTEYPPSPLLPEDRKKSQFLKRSETLSSNKSKTMENAQNIFVLFLARQPPVGQTTTHHSR
jgi:hypothetical protein